MNPFDADQGEGESELFDFRFTNPNPAPEETPSPFGRPLQPIQPSITQTPPSLPQNTILSALQNGRGSSVSQAVSFDSMLGPSEVRTPGLYNQLPPLPSLPTLSPHNGSMFPHLGSERQALPDQMNHFQATPQLIDENLPSGNGRSGTWGSKPVWEEAKESWQPSLKVQYIPPSERRRLQDLRDQQKRASSEPPRPMSNDEDEDSLVFKSSNGAAGAAAVTGTEEGKDSNQKKDQLSDNSGDCERLSDDSLDKEPDPKKCQYCKREYKSEKVVEAHYRRVHEKKVKKLEKKLHKKAHEKYKPSKKNKLTLPQFKAQMILEKPDKYGMLKPRFRKEMKMLKEIKHAEENAYTSDLDVDLSNGDEPSVDNMKVNFAKLVPNTHQYLRQFQMYWENIQNGNMKNGLYERFFFDLLLDSPRCEHCMAPLQNNNTGIKNHINYYHFDIDLSKERYSYLDVHKYMQEVYKYPYLIFDNVNKKTSTLCPVPNCGAQFGKVAKISGQLLIGKQILFADHFVKWHSDEEAFRYGYSIPFFRWILQVYQQKVLKQFKHEIQL